MVSDKSKYDLTTPDEFISDKKLSEEELGEYVNRIERIISGEREENVVCFDECGNIIGHLRGERNAATIPKEYLESSIIITHNHPDGGTLSATDVSRLYEGNAEEIRAVAGGVWYSIKQTENTLQKPAVVVRKELGAYMDENEYLTIFDVCESKGICVNREKGKGIIPKMPEWMNKRKFVSQIQDIQRETKLLRILRLHQALSKYAEANNLEYKIGVLE